MLSEDPDTAASTIIRAIEYGESEAILSLTGKIAAFIQGIAPSWVSSMMSMANKFLPDAVTGSDLTLKGYEAESELSRGPVAILSDRQAARNNEI